MNHILRGDLEFICSNTIVDWSRFNHKKILITGANGMLPAYMVFTLLYLNEKYNFDVKVIALVRNINKAKAKFADYLTDNHLTFLVQDVAEQIFCKEHIDFIIHAASQASPKYYGTDPVGTIDANLFGTTNTLKLAHEHHCESYLYFSSGEVYGIINKTKPSSETDYGLIDPLKVRSCYGESKRMGENLCTCWNYQYGTHAKIVRPFHTYGPGLLKDDGRVFADLVFSILEDKDIVLRSDGTAIRAFCYISDATIELFKVLLDGIDGEAYNIGNDSNAITIRDLANQLIGLYPEKKLKVVYDINMEDMRTGKMKSPLSVSIPNMDKTVDLGYKPVITIYEGFTRTIASFSHK